MNEKKTKQFKKTLVALGLSLTALYGVKAAEVDSWTEAPKGEAWDKWVMEWEEVKNDWTQLSLTPGKNETELNFAWYAPVDLNGIPTVKISQSLDMKDAIEFTGEATSAVEGYLSNKVTVTDLEANTTYYYIYGQDGEWSEPTVYQTQSGNQFSFIVTSDPQIGSSSKSVAAGENEPLGQDKSTRNDSFNWNHTINQALSIRKNASFMINVGDQIQTRDKQQEQLLYTENEIEYAGYLSPLALKSLPVATVIGNHDSPSGNYSFHFNNPNATGLGQTMAGGGYYYSYGDALFIIINSNSDKFDEHAQLVEEAVASHPDAKWRFIALHHDIYGSGEHSNTPSMVTMRYELVPIFEEYQIDVVFTGHDHTYTRSKVLTTATKDDFHFLTDEEFEQYFDREKAVDERYETYLDSVEDEEAIADTQVKNGVVSDPNGIIYYTLNSASGSKYYKQVEKQQAYIESRWQENVPTFMVVDVTESSVTLKTYRTDTMELIDESVTIEKSNQTAVDNQQDLSVTDPVVNHQSLKVGVGLVGILLVGGIIIYVKKR
ncbi:MAG: metallophosphoesterase family protein [Turicibacter sp.]|nr:metallophosphoesterase family protein [Turicibacter sp.]